MRHRHWRVQGTRYADDEIFGALLVVLLAIGFGVFVFALAALLGGCGGELLDPATSTCCDERDAGWACADDAPDPWDGASCYWFAGGCFEACR